MTLPLPIDYDALRRALVAAVSLGTGLPAGQVIMLEAEQPGAPRPPAPYVGILVTSPSVQAGWDWPTPAPDAPGSLTGMVFYNGLRTCSVSFEAYGASHEQAYGVMGAWQAALMTPPVQQVLESASASVQQIGSVADLSTLLNTAYEGRAQMDVDLCLASQLMVDTGLMQQAGVTGSVDISDTQTVTVSVTQTQEP